jgi:hypothetical protein
MTSEAAIPIPRISLRRALAFPFTQKNWPLALAYIGAIQFVPLLGYLVIRGWRFEIAKRVGNGDAAALPDWRHFVEHLKQGSILLGATIFHYIPLYLLLSMPRWGIIWTLLEIVRWCYESLFTHIQQKPLWEILQPGLKSLAIFVVIMLLVPPILSAILESATQRYAETGRVRTLFEVWNSIWLAGGDLADVVRIEMGILVLSVAVFTISILLMLTVGGSALIPPVMVPVYMWTRGALMGQWIAKNRAEAAAKCLVRV